MRPLSIGELARKGGVGVETIRFYERQGLLEEPARKESGYRQYAADVVTRLRFIRRAKELGFTLNEIKKLIALQHAPEATGADARQAAETKIADIETKVRDLQRMREALLKLTAACHGDGPASGCPILEALDPPESGEPTEGENHDRRPTRSRPGGLPRADRS